VTCKKCLQAMACERRWLAGIRSTEVRHG